MMRDAAIAALGKVTVSEGKRRKSSWRRSIRKLSRLFVDVRVWCVQFASCSVLTIILYNTNPFRVFASGSLHVPTAEALMGPVVVAMTNTVGRIELLTWLKSFVAQISAGEVGP